MTSLQKLRNKLAMQEMKNMQRLNNKMTNEMANIERRNEMEAKMKSKEDRLNKKKNDHLT